MIKVGILGAESPLAGELIRLLLHHPEVELDAVVAPVLKGLPVTAHHKGLVGETDLNFTDLLQSDSLDLIFAASPLYLDTLPKPGENLKVVYLGSDPDISIPTFEGIQWIPAVSEMFRKPLVRGAVASRILTPPGSVALIALFPLALHLLLNNTLQLQITLPEFSASHPNEQQVRGELEDILKEVQLSFSRFADVSIKKGAARRAVKVEISFDCMVTKEEIEKLYQDIYDDHNFTFLVSSPPTPAEVEGTHKCLLYIDKPEEGKVVVTAVADAVFRGGVGDAIHAMNLLFGLFEKIGLSLPASRAFGN